jgi:hypothetical protein
MKLSNFAAGVVLALAALPLAAMGAPEMSPKVHHVVLVSVDGMHAVDLANYVKAHPQSTLAQLSANGTTYTHAQSAMPSDSFPGMVALVTGGSPASTGVWYDHTYSKYLLSPGSTKDKPGMPGTDLAYDESIDKGFNDGNWGNAAINPLDNAGASAIDPAALPVDPKTFTPVYPHNFILVNTVFEVIKAAGMHTAWSDKHAAYDILNGPSGMGIEDLYTPEINSPANGKDGDDFTTDVNDTVRYDAMKVQAVVNELMGMDHTGKTKMAVPAILGLNFQAVSVGQKLPKGGYADAMGTPAGMLVTGLDSVDAGMAKIVAAIKSQNLDKDTVIILSAKHGQSPIDPAKIQWVDDSNFQSVLKAKGIEAETASNDTVAYLWLKDPSQAKAAADVLMAVKSVYPVWDKATKKNLFEKDDQAGTWGKVDKILYGDMLPYKDPSGQGRYPDLIIQNVPGSVYGKPWKKLAEHGGFSEDDVHVAMLVSGAGVKAATIDTPVRTAQVAPTILKALGLDPMALQSVAKEKTAVLPGLY